MAAEMCDIQPGDTVAVWGAGPIGLLAASSAYLMGAERVIVIDQVDHRLELARRRAGAETIDFSDTDVNQTLREMTGGRGPDACIDAVGMEADHGMPLIKAYERVKQATRQETDRAHALRQAITACKNGGTVSIVGVYGGFVDKFPMGSLMNRSLTVRTGQCHAHRYLKPLLARIESGQIDPSYVVTHRMPLDSAPAAYETFKHKQDDCVKVVLTP